MIRCCTYLLILSCLLIDSGCRYSEDYVAPTPDFPAPFSYKPAPIQLAEAYFNDELWAKYIYKNGRLAEHHNLVLVSSLAQKTYGISYYGRSGGTLNSLTYWVWPGIATYEGGEIGPLERRSTLTFQPPQSDTLREAALSEPNRVASVTYSINPQGYIMGVNGLTAGSKWLFKRNVQNNVSQVQYWYLSQPTPTVVTYKYDDHPNPFFAMGRMGDLAVDTSPNNVTQSTDSYTIDKETHNATTTYNYTYRSDGYPERVIVKRSYTAFVDTIRYVYNK